MKLSNYLSISMLLFFTVACDDFVEEPTPRASVGSAQAFSSEGSVNAIFTGIYRRIRFFNDGEGDDSEAVGSILNTWNVKGNDFIRPQFSWFVFEYRYQDVANATGRKTNLIWNEMYEVSNTCNILIEEVEKGSLPETVKIAFIAEARAIRGWAYHHLIREYGHAYVHGRDNPGVPIYMEPASIENALDGNPRSTVGEVYDHIRADLEFASSNLTSARVAKWRINKNVADGFLARVYLYMGLYAEAAQAAQTAREGFSLDASNYKSGFDDISSKEWMWGAPQSNDQSLFFGGFASFWDGTRYARIFANPNFVANFTETDVRNTFTIQGSGPHGKLYRTSKFNAASDFSEDLVLMRVAEMYLIEAEAQARLGDDATSAMLLLELQVNRDADSAVASGNTGEALVSEIMLERRKELYGEGGPDFIDFRRLGLGFTRDEFHTTKVALMPKDSKYLYPIPQAEIDSNEEISASDQNE